MDIVPRLTTAELAHGRDEKRSGYIARCPATCRSVAEQNKRMALHGRRIETTDRPKSRTVGTLKDRVVLFSNAEASRGTPALAIGDLVEVVRGDLRGLRGHVDKPADEAPQRGLVGVTAAGPVGSGSYEPNALQLVRRAKECEG